MGALNWLAAVAVAYFCLVATWITYDRMLWILDRDEDGKR